VDCRRQIAKLHLRFLLVFSHHTVRWICQVALLGELSDAVI